MEECGSCKFWKELDEPAAIYEGCGDCRRFPPSLRSTNPDDIEHPVFPMVSSDMWCGEYKPKP